MHSNENFYQNFYVFLEMGGGERERTREKERERGDSNSSEARRHITFILIISPHLVLHSIFLSYYLFIGTQFCLVKN